MALEHVASWVRNILKPKTKNEVTPVEIFVQPRQQEESPHIEYQEHSNISVFTVEDELQYVRLWYSNDNNKTAAAAALGEGRTGDIERSRLLFRSTSNERFDALESAFNAPCSYSKSQPLQSTIPKTEQSCYEKIWGIIIHIKSAILKGKRKTQQETYIYSYLNVMYLFCVSAVRTNANQQNNDADLQKWPRWILVKLQLGIFALFAFLSAFQSFCQAKYDVLWFLFEGGLNQFVKFSFNVTCLGTSIYGSYLFCNKRTAVKKMTDGIISYERNWASMTNKPAICGVVAFITVLLAFCRSFLIIDIRDFAVEDGMLESSYQMSEDIFLWSSKNLNISIQKLDEEFGTDLNWIEILLAIVKIVRDFAYNLQDGMLWDLIGCVVLSMNCWMSCFMRHVTEVIDNVLDKTSEEWRVLQQKRELLWKTYREIRIVFEAVNNVFDPLLLLFHASNVLRYAFFMENLIYPGDTNILTYVHLLYNIVKSEITYMVASRIAQQNKVIRKWLRNWGSQNGKVDVGYTEIDMNAVLDELDEEPLGLGKDFIIHQGFHFGLFGLVSSLFVMLASKKQ